MDSGPVTDFEKVLPAGAPLAFTEQGVAMLSSVLRSERAIQVNIAIVRAFVRLREATPASAELRRRIETAEARLDHHGEALAAHESWIAEAFARLDGLIAPRETAKRPLGFRVSNPGPGPGTIVLRHERNRGKGAAIRTGLTRASGEIVLIQDADLEYNPEELPALLAPVLRGETCVVYGSRFMGEVRKMRLANRVANWLLARMASLLYGQRVADEATAYKIFRGDLIRSIPLRCERYEFCPEVTAKVLRRGERIVELPVTFEARTVEEGKKIGWPDFFQAVWTLLKYRFLN